ncbi:hypothetical protein HDU96_001423 [Phlyctochytrium bullatum]|nr:hypothetical protein HDU96_001423 [Phlyctochytrium bullatum]
MPILDAYKKATAPASPTPSLSNTPPKATNLPSSPARPPSSKPRPPSYPVDLTDHAAVTAAIAKIRATQGPVGLLHWHPMGPFLPFFGADPAAFASELGLVVSFVAAVQATKEDLVATKGSVLVTGGGSGPEAEASVKLAAAFGAATVAIGKAATRKAMFLAHELLKDEGVYVGEVTIFKAIKGTTFDPEGKSDTSPEDIAGLFWELHTQRDRTTVNVQ